MNVKFLVPLNNKYVVIKIANTDGNFYKIRTGRCIFREALTVRYNGHTMVEGNAVDRQVRLTLTSTGDFCYNSKPFISPKFHQKNILSPRYKIDTAHSSGNFCNYL